MKAGESIRALDDMTVVSSMGDVRRIVSTAMLALVRKEVSAADATALADLCDAMSNNVNAEVKLAKAQIELREKGANLGNVVEMGKLLLT
jgi:hypothetical protein